jgi:hypothetical protein
MQDFGFASLHVNYRQWAHARIQSGNARYSSDHKQSAIINSAAVETTSFK